MSTDAAARPAGPKTRTSSPLSIPAAASPAAAPKIRRETVTIRDGLKVVRIVVPAGGSIPQQHSSVTVVVTVIRGAGTFMVAGRSRPVHAGSVVDMTPGCHHAIHAAEELELVIMHARLARPATTA